MRTACLHIENYPAWAIARAEQFRQPVVITARGKAIAWTSSYKTRSIEPGISAERVGKLLPEAHIVERDAQVETAVWEEVLYEVHRLTPFLETPQAGWVFLRSFDGEALRDLVKQLPARAGVAPHRASARLASVRSAAGTVLDISSENRVAFLNQYPTALLSELGFSGEFVEQLEFFGYRTLGASLHLTQRQLTAQFGEEGGRLHGMLHPGGELPVGLFQLPPALRQAYDFERPASEPAEFHPVLRHLIEQAVAALPPAMICHRITVFARPHRCTDTRFRCRILSDGTRGKQRIFNVSSLLLQEILQAFLEIDEIVIELGSLRQQKNQQSGLFMMRPPVHKAVSAVHRRFPEAIKQVTLVQDALFHEQEMRLEPFPERDDLTTGVASAPGLKRRRKS